MLVFQSEFLVIPAIWWIPRFLRSCFWVIAKVTGKCSGTAELGRRLVRSVAKNSSQAGATKVSHASAS